MNDTDGSGRIRSVAANILVFLSGLALGVSAILKFAGVPAVVHQMASAGFTDARLMLVASLELLAALLFLYPKTLAVGVFFHVKTAGEVVFLTRNPTAFAMQTYLRKETVIPS